LAADCFPVQHVIADGLVPQLAFVQDELKQYDGACLDPKLANAIATHLTHELVERGYVTTRVLIPEQDVSHGSFHLRVTPGTIRNIKFAGASPATWRNAFPTRPGALLNERDLEQGLEQMKRVPSVDVTMQIVPADAPGQSDVLITVKRTSPWQVAIDINNAGTNGSVYQGSLSVAYDNVAHANDILSLSLNSPVQGGVGSGSTGNGGSYSIPDGLWTFTIAANTFNYTQNVAGYQGSFTLSGIQHHTEFDLDRALVRNAFSKTSVALTVAGDSSETFADGTEIDVQYTRATYAEISLHREAHVDKGVFTTSIGMRAGLPIFGTLPDVPVPNAPTNYYSMGVIDVGATLPLHYHGATFTWKPALHGQATGNEIASAQQFSIGNRYTVRGFDGSSTLVAESGYYFRNDIEAPFKHVPAAVYVGVDTGCVWGANTVNLLGHSLTGMAIGIRGSTRHVSFDGSLGWPLSTPIGFPVTEPVAAIDLTLRS
jgi:hemolysin activation/secretion protein